MFEEAYKPDGLSVKEMDELFKVVPIQGKKNEFLLNCDLGFLNWPYRVNNHSHHIDIVLQSVERFKIENGKIKTTKSNVRLKYYQLNGADKSEATPLFDVHFDYEEDVKQGHPVYHAQFGKVDFDFQRLKNLKHDSKYFLKPKDISDFGAIRIPTPYMNVISVFLLIASGHLSNDRFLGFRKSVTECRTSDWILTKHPEFWDSDFIKNLSHPWYQLS